MIAEGMAMSRPTTVVSNAPAMPGATFITISEEPELAMAMNDSMTPHTVPKRPREGAVVVQGAQASWHDRQCRALDAQIRNLDAMARQGGGPQKMDHIARQRREVRDRMFRLHC